MGCRQTEQILPGTIGQAARTLPKRSRRVPLLSSGVLPLGFGNGVASWTYDHAGRLKNAKRPSAAAADVATLLGD